MKIRLGPLIKFFFLLFALDSVEIKFLKKPLGEQEWTAQWSDPIKCLFTPFTKILYMIISFASVVSAELELIVRLLLAIALGGLVGYERELTHRPAGLRTHMLVSLGACLFTIISITYFTSDTARIAAGIVTGIGFIGAGSIIAMRGHVMGVTTAASLWAVAAIGVAAGIGYYIIAIVASVFIFLILQIRKVEKELVSNKRKR